MGCSPWGCEESDTTEQLPFYFSLSCIGEGNGNPLQCSCLENPRVGGAWWAAVYGVSWSRTRLKRLSSSSSSLKWMGIQVFPIFEMASSELSVLRGEYDNNWEIKGKVSSSENSGRGQKVRDQIERTRV